MYKVMKDNKIIAVLETDIVFGLNYDTIEQDTEHNIDDYDQYNGEYLLKDEIPAPTHEDIESMRIAYRREHIDSHTIARMRKQANSTWTEEMEEEYLALDAEVTAYIEEHLPYPIEE